MRTLIKARVKDIEDILTLRQHIATLEGLEKEQVLSVQPSISNVSGKRFSVKPLKDCIFICTRHGSLIDGNQPFMEMLGYSIEELFGLNIIDLCINPASGAQFLKSLDEKGYVVDYKMRLRKKDDSELVCIFTSTIRWYNDENIPDNQPLFKTWVRSSK